MEVTHNLGLPLLYKGQLNKDITVNTAFLMLDSLINASLITLNPYQAPPTNLEKGNLILTSHDAKEEFIDFANHIAFYENGWYFVKPKEGLILWVKDQKKCVVFVKDKFVDIMQEEKTEVGSSQKLQELEERIRQLENPIKIGINSNSDDKNKLVVKSNYTLFNNEDGDVRIILNKKSDENTASFIFQSNWNGIAEFGSINGKNFILKIAQEGEWKEVFEINTNNGSINFKQDVLKNGNKIF